MKTLSGRELAAEIRAATATRVAELVAAGTVPRLAVVSATPGGAGPDGASPDGASPDGASRDEASASYVRVLSRAAVKVGIHCLVIDTADVAGTLAGLNADPLVHGILLQTPLPGGARLAEFAEAIGPAKDVDGASPAALGRLMTGLPAYAPATAEAVVRLLDYHGVALGGTRVVVVGRSAIVGKPVAHLLLDRDATVTVCHSRTRDLASVTSSAEVLVVAAGRPGLIGVGHVAPGAVVVDVGTNVLDTGEMVGDVAPEVAAVAGALSPVPGGVGPVTTAVLLRHVVEAAGR